MYNSTETLLGICYNENILCICLISTLLLSLTAVYYREHILSLVIRFKKTMLYCAFCDFCSLQFNLFQLSTVTICWWVWVWQSPEHHLKLLHPVWTPGPGVFLAHDSCGYIRMSACVRCHVSLSECIMLSVLSLITWLWSSREIFFFFKPQRPNSFLNFETTCRDGEIWHRSPMGILV